MLEEERERIKKEGRLGKEEREKIKKRIEESKEGKRKKFRLGKACMEYALPIWNKEYKYNQRPAYLIQITEDYIKQKVSKSSIEKEFWEFCIDDLKYFQYKPGKEKYACITRAAAVICYEYLSKEIPSNSKIYSYISSDLEDAITLEWREAEVGWDSAALIGLAMEKEKEKEYWLWYIEKVEELLKEKEEERIFTEQEKEVTDYLNNQNFDSVFEEELPFL